MLTATCVAASPSLCVVSSRLSVIRRLLVPSEIARPSATTTAQCRYCRRMGRQYSSATGTAASARFLSAAFLSSSSSSSRSLSLRRASPIVASLPSLPTRHASGAAATGSTGFLSGLTSRLSSVVDDRRAVAADNKFSAMVGDMLAVGKYRLSDHVRFMEQTAADAGVVGWKSYMPGVSGQAGVEELRRMLAILNSFSAAEQSDTTLIGRETRLRVATATGRTVADVNFVLRQYSGAVMVHQWLHSRKARGLPLPTTQSELSNMMAIDRPPQTPQMRHKPRRR